MKELIGFVGLGQCGGNIVNLLDSDFTCLAINSSKEDLDTINTKYQFHIPNAKGCSHDREKAIYLIKQHHDKIIEEIGDKLFHQKLIYLCFSTSGGTGSGAAPILLEMLNTKFPDKYFGCVTVIPSETELLKPQYNAFKCYKELSNIDKLASVFTIDNNKGEKLTLNNRFVSKFKGLLDIPKSKNSNGNMDYEELFKILTTRGSIFVSTCKSSNPDNLVSTIIRSCKESDVFVDMEDDKQIAYMGLSLPNEIDMEHLKKSFGMPYDCFINYSNENVITILSGLSFPKTRIRKIMDIVDGNKDVIKNNLNNSKTNRIVDDIDDLEGVDNIDCVSSNIDDILSKYS